MHPQCRGDGGRSPYASISTTHCSRRREAGDRNLRGKTVKGRQGEGALPVKLGFERQRKHHVHKWLSEVKPRVDLGTRRALCTPTTPQPALPRPHPAVPVPVTCRRARGSGGTDHQRGGPYTPANRHAGLTFLPQQPKAAMVCRFSNLPYLSHHTIEPKSLDPSSVITMAVSL